MTRKHKIFFRVWQLKCWLYGIKTGTYVRIFTKNGSVMGVVRGMTGDSITRNIYGFQFQVDWLGATEGADNRFYSEGSYTLDDYLNGVIKKL